MAVKKKILNTRTKLILLIAVLIILIGYVIISNLPPSIEFLTPGQVSNNQEQYINQTVTIKGYLDKNTEEIPVVTSTMDATNPRSEIKLDLSNIEIKDDLIEGRLFYFTGIIKEDKSIPNTLIVFLEVEEFDNV